MLTSSSSSTPPAPRAARAYKSQKLAFRYSKSLSQADRKRFAALGSCVQRIRFHTHRWYCMTQTIEFRKPVAMSTAVATAERFLSEPLTASYYRARKDHPNGWYYAEPFEATTRKTRGDMLGDAVYLERIQCLGEGTFLLQCGS